MVVRYNAKVVCVTFSFKAAQYGYVFSYNSAQKLMLFVLGTGGNIRLLFHVKDNTFPISQNHIPFVFHPF